MRTAFLGVSNTILNKAGLDGLRSGDIITVKIIENNNGLIKASIMGRSILLKGPANLQIGQIYRVKTQWTGKTLLLNLIHNKNNASDIFGAPGQTDLGFSMLYSAAKRAALHLKNENVELLKRLLRKKGPLNEEKARLAAEAVKKGLAPEELISIIEHRSGEDRGSQEKTLLFNHLKDGNELWFIIPYSFGIDGTQLSGSLRIKKNTDSGKLTTAVIETEIDSSRLFFMISDFNSEKRRLKVFSEQPLDNSVKNKIKSGLPEILGNLSMKFDDNIIENCFRNQSLEMDFDGFSCEETSADGIEEVV